VQRVIVLSVVCALLAAGAAPAATRDATVSWRTVGSTTATALPAPRLLGVSSFGGSGWRAVVFSSAADVAHALPSFAQPLRSAIQRARASTNFGYRRLVLVGVATEGGCCPVQLAEISTAGGTAALTIRQIACPTCAVDAPSYRVLLVSVPRMAFGVPRRLGVTVQAPPVCPAGYSYAGFVSAPAANLTATLTMSRLPTLVTPLDHALAYASIVARDAEQVPREWLQVGIGRGAMGAYPDDGRAWVYVEAQTTTGYQLTEIAPAAVGVPVTLAFTGSGSTWTVAIDGKVAYSADLGVPATGTSTSVEVYRATGGGACPSLGFALDGVTPRCDRRGLLPLLNETPGGWTVRLG
jgi:hypothetical protein